MKPTSAFVLTLVLAASLQAHADKPARSPKGPHAPTKAEVDALDSKQARDYYQSNTDWPNWASTVTQTCSSYKEFFGASFVCTFDEKAAEAFYWNEVTTKSPDKWNNANPGFACASNSLSNMTTPFEVCKDSKKCSDELKSKIKSVECRLVVGDVGPSVKLEGSKLVFLVGYPSKGLQPGEGGYYWWINRDLLAQFPAYKAQWKVRNLREDTF
jgi:hypothetical protein